MRAKWFVVITVMIGCVSGVAAQSQPPVPTPSKATQHQQQVSPNKAEQGKINKQPTKPGLAPINQATTPPSSEQKQSTGAESKDYPSTDWWSVTLAGLTVLFTAVLATVAVLQWRSMKRQADVAATQDEIMGRQTEFIREQASNMVKGLALTREAAKAAQDSANAARDNVELAKVQLRPYVEVAWCKLIDGELFPGQLIVQLGIVNNGGTPAGITSFETNYNFALVTEDFSRTERSDDGFYIGEVFPSPSVFLYKIDIDRKAVPSEPFTLQVYGRIIYHNRVDNRPETIDFGHMITKLTDGNLTYQRADGMRQAFESFREQAGKKTRSAVFLGGDPHIGVSSRR